MASALSGIPYARRRQLAATLGLFAVLFVAVGTVALTGDTSGLVRAFATIVLVVAVFMALIGWGVAHSVRTDLRDDALDRAIEDAIAEHDLTCGCGVDHDPAEMHVHGHDGTLGPACEHDGAGAACAHDCASCVLASMRPSPSQTRAERLAD